MRPRPDAGALRRFLQSPAILRPNGEVLSWANEAHPGYAYPEAGGLWLSAQAGEAATSPQADAVARWLVSLVEKDGAVGRGGILYAFDSAVALRGLLHHRAAARHHDEQLDQACVRLYEFLCERLSTRRPLLPPDPAEHRWSLSFGPHLLKTFLALQAFDEAFGSPTALGVIGPLLELAWRLDDLPAADRPVYLHAYCYALEGAWALAERDLSGMGPDLDLAFEWLVEQQLPSGGLPSFSAAKGVPPRTDATAQAIRLWVMRDREAFVEPIARALTFLASCQAPSGAIYYEPASRDENTWASLFTAQCLRWLGLDESPPEGTAKPEELL